MRTSVIVPFHRQVGQLRACLSAIRRSMPEAELIVAADGASEAYEPVAREHGAHVVVVPHGPRGPAVARNHGAAAAGGDVLVFVDTDVVAAPDAVSGMAGFLAANPEIAAVFGAYDRQPAAPTFMSQFKNLSHAYVHEVGRPEASTFWAGLGAVRADAFRTVGGFDERMRQPSVEDIDLGYRLRRAGYRLRLDVRFRGTHLKRWTFLGCVTTDLVGRGIPWVQLIRRGSAMANDLNTSLALRASVVAAYGAVLSMLLAPFVPWAATAGVVLLALLPAMSYDYYRWMAARRGWLFAMRVVPVHFVHHLCNGVSYVTGSLLYAAGRAGIALPGVLPVEPWPAAAAGVSGGVPACR